MKGEEEEEEKDEGRGKEDRDELPNCRIERANSGVVPGGAHARAARRPTDMVCCWMSMERAKVWLV